MRRSLPALSPLARGALVLATACGLAPAAAAGQEWLRPGHPDVDGSRLTAGLDTTRVFLVQDGVEREGPLQIEKLSHRTRDGERFLVQVLRIVGPRTLTDTTVYRLPGLAPVSHRSHRPGGELLSLDYGESGVEGEHVIPDSVTIPIERTFEAPVFDPGIGSLLLRVLPLREGYEARVPMFNHSELEPLASIYRVTGETRVATEDGEVPAWTVEVTLFDGRVIRHSVAKTDGRVLASETEFEGPSGTVRMIVRPPGL